MEQVETVMDQMAQAIACFYKSLREHGAPADLAEAITLNMAGEYLDASLFLQMRAAAKAASGD